VKCVTEKFFFLILIFFFSSSAWGDVQVRMKRADKTLMTIYLSKSITEEDYSTIIEQSKLIGIISKGSPVVTTISLDSTGGSVSSALKIGRFLREMGALATVYKNSICYSSCVYVLAGAPNRAVDGSVGIHRPYELVDTTSSAQGQKSKYSQLSTQIVTYLKEMNIPTSLYEDSLFISPERIKILSFDAMQAYGLNENDPYADEAESVRQSIKLGISRAEYGKREARAYAECGLGSFSLDMPEKEAMAKLECQSAVMDGSR